MNYKQFFPTAKYGFCHLEFKRAPFNAMFRAKEINTASQSVVECKVMDKNMCVKRKNIQNLLIKLVLKNP